MIFIAQAWTPRSDAWANQTTVHPVGAFVLAICCMAILLASRRVAALAFFVFTIYVSSNQRIVIAGLDFDFTRILILTALLRIATRGEFAKISLRPQDYMITAFVVISSIAMVIRKGPEGIENRLGFGLTALGIYFTTRGLIRSRRDLEWLVRPLVVAMVPVAILFLIEKSTARNPFAFLGGVAEITAVRNGRLRCQGAFAHPILAGVFFATSRAVVLRDISRQSTSKNQRWLRNTDVLRDHLCVFVEHARERADHRRNRLVDLAYSKIPSRSPMGACGGLHCTALFNGEWYRAHLRENRLCRGIDWMAQVPSSSRRGLSNFSEWALVGTNSSAHWGHGLYDMTNQYLLEGVTGGFLSMLALLAIIVLAFRSVGVALRAIGTSSSAYLVYGLGVMMLVPFLRLLLPLLLWPDDHALVLLFRCDRISDRGVDLSIHG